MVGLAWAGGEQEAPALLVTGAGPDAADAGLAVVPAGALAVDAAVPMAGRWHVDGGAMRFVPRMPFARGTVYAVLRPGPGGTWSELGRLQRPAVLVVPSTSVAAIHPDVEEVPENLLRLAVTFSAPMEEGGAAGRIRLEDASGDEIPQALLPMPPELWDRPRRRLTLLLEPGRIKRGLVPNTALGAPLAHRPAFDLVVGGDARDASGAALVGGARRTYRVGPPVRSRVEPLRWGVRWPADGTQEPLVVVFDRPLDRALVLRCIRVADERGRTITGAGALEQGDLRWVFSPDSAWPAGGARLHVDTALEDLAGNSVRRVFDRDLRLRADDPVEAAEVVLAPA